MTPQASTILAVISAMVCMYHGLNILDGIKRMGTVLMFLAGIYGVIIGSIGGWQVIGPEVGFLMTHFFIPFAVFSVLLLAMGYTTLWTAIDGCLDGWGGIALLSMATIGCVWYRYCAWVIETLPPFGQAAGVALAITIAGCIPQLARRLTRQPQPTVC